jgi:hypothetical protein
MLSPYSNVPKKSHSKSPRRQASKDTPKEITDYINNKGEIQFPELLCDEVAKVDESLLKAAKKDGQVGGKWQLLIRTQQRRKLRRRKLRSNFRRSEVSL